MSRQAFHQAIAHLTGRGAALAPEEGAAAMTRLADGGDADAALCCAVLAGAGFGRGRNWSHALDWLETAAAHGQAEAHAQLALLANASPASPPAALRSGIDLAAWTAPRPAKLVVSTPRIGLSPGFLEPAVCAWIVRRAGPLQRQAQVYNPVSGRAGEHDSRTNTSATFTIAELDVVMLLVRQRIANTLNVDVLNLERFSVFRYLTGQRFSRHVDFLDPGTAQFAADLARFGQRAATFLVYLNEDFEAGETTFLSIAKKFKGKSGDAVFFYNVDAEGRPDRLTLHEGSAPTSGEKWLLSQFIRDRPQRPG